MDFTGLYRGAPGDIGRFCSIDRDEGEPNIAGLRASTLKLPYHCTKVHDVGTAYSNSTVGPGRRNGIGTKARNSIQVIVVIARTEPAGAGMLSINLLCPTSLSQIVSFLESDDTFKRLSSQAIAMYNNAKLLHED